MNGNQMMCLAHGATLAESPTLVERFFLHNEKRTSQFCTKNSINIEVLADTSDLIPPSIHLNGIKHDFNPTTSHMENKIRGGHDPTFPIVVSGYRKGTFDLKLEFLSYLLIFSHKTF